uniref:Uncharacterized protein n=1 Tax=Solanum lycopersicum TaxID=4081 RepID=A0A3Q7FC05_SOLLC
MCVERLNPKSIILIFIATSKYSHSDDIRTYLASFGFKGEVQSSISVFLWWKLLLKLTGDEMNIGSITHMGGTICLGLIRMYFQVKNSEPAILFGNQSFVDERHVIDMR